MPKAEIIKRPVEQISGDVKKSAWSAVIESLAILILGILLIVWPDTIITIIAYIVGAFLIIKGGFQVITYFIDNGQKDYFNNNLLAGVVSILIGVAALILGKDIANVFRVIIGVLIIYEALVRINTSIKLHAANVSIWPYTLIIALIIMLLGIFVTFNSGAVVVLIGWIMVATGIMGIIGDVMFIQHINSIVDQLTKK